MSDPNIRKLSKDDLLKSFGPFSWNREGRVCDIVGTVVEASLPNSQLSCIAEIIPHSKQRPPILAEVVGFRGDKTLLMPYEQLNGIGPGARIRGQRMFDQIPVGDFLVGRIFDPFMKCLSQENFKSSVHSEYVSIDNTSPNPLTRERISQPLPLGVRAVDGLLTFCEGQRMAIMAGSGVGKSVLMGMMARGTEAEINVIGLIGERGREVREFLEKDLGTEGLKRSIVIVSTSDHSPLMRVRAAKVVMSIAEYFSGRGKKVLIMLDSLTRIAQAQREIGLAIGEPPTTKGYTPSVFSLLPKILERCGPQPLGKGSISGLFSVLVDGDDFNDPIPDTVRSIVDGHIVLSRELATLNHFPAIDVTSSLSRVMIDVATPQHQKMAARFKSLISVYEENFDFVQLGAYQAGTNKLLDIAIRLKPVLDTYLKQDMNQRSKFDESFEGLTQINNLLDREGL